MASDPNSTALAPITVSPVDYLTPRERGVYDIYKRAGIRKELAPSFEAKLFSLFLQGKTCEQIASINPSLSLGAVVALRVERGWDVKKEEHRESLEATAQEVARQTFMESVQFHSDLLAVAHKQEQEGLMRFMQDGNPEHLGPLAIKNIKQYLATLESLASLTGQNNTRRVKGEVVHRFEETVNEPGGSVEVVPAAPPKKTVRRALSPAVAKAILQGLHSGVDNAHEPDAPVEVDVVKEK